MINDVACAEAVVEGREKLFSLDHRQVELKLSEIKCESL